MVAVELRDGRPRQVSRMNVCGLDAVSVAFFELQVPNTRS